MKAEIRDWLRRNTNRPIVDNYCIHKPSTDGIMVDKNTQSKVKESKVKESKGKERKGKERVYPYQDIVALCVSGYFIYKKKTIWQKRHSKS